jgi:hypothetical protein
MTELPQTIDDNRITKQIVSIVEISSKCGQAIAVNEIALLLPYEQEAVDILSIIQTDPQLLELLSLEKELVVQRGYEHLFAERAPREISSKRDLEIAKAFGNQLVRRCPYLKFIAVSGSVAYNSANKSDDIDLILVARKNRLWLSILKTLLLARAFRTKARIKGEKIELCLSYAQEKIEFEEKLRRHKTFLFAREFLSIQVLTGLNYYRALLEKTNWIRHMFPRLHASKMLELKQKQDQMLCVERKSVASFYDALNLLIYAGLRYYLLFKAFLLNIRYRSQHKIRDLFEANITRDSFVYSSRKYQEIEKAYRSLRLDRK